MSVVVVVAAAAAIEISFKYRPLELLIQCHYSLTEDLIRFMCSASRNSYATP
jgi:hypothetical protein